MLLKGGVEMFIQIWHKGNSVGQVKAETPILTVPANSLFSVRNKTLYIKIPSTSVNHRIRVDCTSDTVILDLDSSNQYIMIGATVDVYIKSES